MNTKIKLDYQQLLSFSDYVGGGIEFYTHNNYAQKTVLAVLIEWHSKKIFPKACMQYTGTKTISLTKSEGYAFVDMYTNMYKAEDYILPKVMALANQIDSTQLPF
jgi:hypothetical protein